MELSSLLLVTMSRPIAFIVKWQNLVKSSLKETGQAKELRTDI